jgi:hypothetical protein
VSARLEKGIPAGTDLSSPPTWVLVQAAAMKGIFRSRQDVGAMLPRDCFREELQRTGIELDANRFENSFMVAFAFYPFAQWRTALPDDRDLHAYIMRNLPVLK